jgi:RimJ/RimL family protein N-acetyltransferase
MPWTDEQIETERLRLRAYREDDKPGIERMMRSGDTRRYLGGPLDDEAVAGMWAATVGERPGVFCVADLATDVAIGSVSLEHERRGEAEISYELLPDHWGLGLAFEAVGTFLDWTWANLPDPAVVAVTQMANARSRGLLERLGFRFETTFEEFGAAQAQYRRQRPATA